MINEQKQRISYRRTTSIQELTQYLREQLEKGWVVSGSITTVMVPKYIGLGFISFGITQVFEVTMVKEV